MAVVSNEENERQIEEFSFMSLERKDVRFKLDEDMHVALSEFADIDRLEKQELVEQVIVEYLQRRIRDVTLVSERLRRRGLSGNTRDRDPDATQPMKRERP